MCKSTTTATRRRRRRDAHMHPRLADTYTYTRSSSSLSRDVVSRELSSSVPRSHRCPSSFLSLFLFLFSRICFSNGANFRRYGSIGGARSRCGLGRSFGVSCRHYGFCLVNTRRRNAGEAVAHRSNTRIPHTRVHTALPDEALDSRRVSIVAIIADC